MRFGAKKLVLSAGVLVAALLVWFGATHLFAGRADAKPAAPLAAVEKRPLSVTVEASGTAQPPLVVEVKSRASGQLLRLNAETGQQVPRGFLLAQVDPRDAQNALDNARAQLTAAAAKAQESGATLQRATQMKADGVITAQEYDVDRAQAEADRSAVVIARTNYNLAAQKMGDPTIEAPISGTIIEKDVEAGQIIASASQTVSGGTTLFKMADLSTMQVKAEVDETDIGRVQAGQRARVTVEAYPGRTFIGRVEKVEPQAVVDQNVTMFPVLVDIDNAEGLIKPGMNADVEIQVERLESAVVVPNDAVVSPKDAATVAQALGLDPAVVRQQMASMRGRRNGGNDNGNGSSSSTSTWGGRRAGAASGSWGGRSGSGGGWPAGAAAGAAGAGATSEAVRPGIVFVKTAKGTEPRFVLLGMNDLDNSQVIRGVQPGDSVVLASVARLQQQQQNQQNQLKQRAGSMMGGAGGGAGGGRGRG